MVERLLLDGIDAEAGRAAIGGEHHAVAHARAHEAGTALAFVQAAIPRAEVTLDAAIVERMPPPPRVVISGEIVVARAHVNFSTV
jgi:hypothetical protein